MSLNRIKRYFELGSVCVCGVKGSGKDLLTGNVIVRRNKPYISNVNYDGKKQSNFFQIDYDKLNTHNDCFDFINGTITPMSWEYPDGTDVYISDASIYFPNYNTLPLNKRYEGIINFNCLSRHIGDTRVHVNAQNISRIWEKLPEHCDTFIRCIRSIYIKHIDLVIQRVIVYERRDSCEQRIPPMPKQRFNFKPKSDFDRQAYELQRISYQAKYGEITPYTLVYINRSKYDTRAFRKILKVGENNAK